MDYNFKLKQINSAIYTFVESVVSSCLALMLVHIGIGVRADMITIGDVMLFVPGLQLVNAVKETLEVTLPELAADIIDRGIYLTGGTGQLRGLRELLEMHTKIPVIIPDRPTECVALGTSVKLRRAR